MSPSQNEVMCFVESFLKENNHKLLGSIETNWQPADLLPDASKETFFTELQEIQELAKEIPYDLLAVLIGDTITEEALPTYESWLYGIDHGPKEEESAWKAWVRGWSAEENRHGDLLNRYLYLSGRVNMRQLEISTQYLIADGFQINTDNCPYRSFVYTSFQELATNISHRRVASLAKENSNLQLAKICGLVAADEARHAKAYKSFVEEILKVDPSGMMIAFEDMMRKKIAMPAHYLRELGQNIGSAFGHFTDAAQRLGVYTTHDYIQILESLLNEWKIEQVQGLNSKAEEARDYLTSLPKRLLKVAERTRIPQLEYKFSWILEPQTLLYRL